MKLRRIPYASYPLTLLKIEIAIRIRGFFDPHREQGAL